MGYFLNWAQADAVLEKLAAAYRIYAPKRFPKQGRYSDTDLIRYDVVGSAREIVTDQKSDLPAKEALSPITQAIFYFTQDEYRESKPDKKRPLIFLRACDINAFERQDRIYLQNGEVQDPFYQRVRERAKFVLIECERSFDTCFCVSMGANRTDSYSAAARFSPEGIALSVPDAELAPYFAGCPEAEMAPRFIEENACTVHIPEIRDKKELAALKKHPMWEAYNDRCISCGACTVACPTCTCFTTSDKIYDENAQAGERRRVSASCEVAGFDCMAGGHEFRTTAAQRMRYRVLHKVHDYKARFGGHHMCVGCGRCSARCPKFINFPATIAKMSAALEEIRGGKEAQA